MLFSAHSSRTPESRTCALCFSVFLLVHLPVRLATNTNTAACTNPSVCAKFGLNYLTRDCGMNLGDLLKPPTNGYQQYMRATRYVDTACLKDSVIDSVYYYLGTPIQDLWVCPKAASHLLPLP
ncbi:uncharacterized protein EV422DRAFT_281815 [Fimicolochytrium jonesii]|uniref:uncharacterized protein n=1 Tax=Fimicolochytrium jonesii TaxID=1396493 RepID=UPI0022FE2AD3|nr:uncharacterized protein EV422DRAFT_281815 [Fimicolochytrium jonesii]KAI8816635.1 hypothetical protein EV422DRAFT_281815 [Fimicolochytrium jonesii]